MALEVRAHLWLRDAVVTNRVTRRWSRPLAALASAQRRVMLPPAARPTRICWPRESQRRTEDAARRLRSVRLSSSISKVCAKTVCPFRSRKTGSTTSKCRHNKSLHLTPALAPYGRSVRRR
jgi:hypothetical protein